MTARWCAIWNRFGLRCVYAGDIATGQDALARSTSTAAPDAIITNPPYTRPLMHPLIEHFQRIAPTWLLLDYGLGVDQAGGAVPAPVARTS